MQKRWADDLGLKFTLLCQFFRPPKVAKIHVALMARLAEGIRYLGVALACPLVTTLRAQAIFMASYISLYGMWALAMPAPRGITLSEKRNRSYGLYVYKV
jgi:hypothetical protein